MQKRIFGLILLIIIVACNAESKQEQNEEEENVKQSIKLTEQEWKKSLTNEEYKVLREKGTERPYSGEYYDHFEPGIYECAGCGSDLFSADTKFDAQCGWPSFYDKIDKKNIKEQPDHSLGMERTEILCANCGGHLGHVFNDGPEPTGLRYCINSVSLNFKKKEDVEKEKKD